MENFKELLNTEIVPTDALIFYQGKVHDVETSDLAYIEHRSIKDGAMGAGKPLKLSTIASLMKTVDKFIKGNTSFVSIHGRVPECLLYVSSNVDKYKIVWYRKPEKRMMYFTKGLDIPNGEMWVPGLVYSSDGSKLKVYAFKGYKPKSILYRAPFFNTGEDGVCLGSARVKKPSEQTFDKWIAYWEEMFWKSEFVHLLGGNPINGNLATVTKECIATGKQFPTDVLIKAKVKLNDLLK